MGQHRAVMNSDVIECILQHYVPYARLPVDTDFSEFAFSGPAYLLLWRELPSFTPLLTLCLPPDAVSHSYDWSTYKVEDLTTQRWQRFTELASYVRRIAIPEEKIPIDIAALSLLAYANTGEPLLPAVREIRCTGVPSIDTIILSIAWPSLHELVVHICRNPGVLDGNYATHRLLCGLSKRTPNLRSLHARAYDLQHTENAPLDQWGARCAPKCDFPPIRRLSLPGPRGYLSSVRSLGSLTASIPLEHLEISDSRRVSTRSPSSSSTCGLHTPCPSEAPPSCIPSHSYAACASATSPGTAISNFTTKSSARSRRHRRSSRRLRCPGTGAKLRTPPGLRGCCPLNMRVPAADYAALTGARNGSPRCCGDLYHQIHPRDWCDRQRAHSGPVKARAPPSFFAPEVEER
ncbi:hypothetical protein C8Q72DRAFT_955248 [Fomitopsis betulina]|nr:hypothetical protein C8Q72DRAFT_955248 [Fomitopsis betulina]